MKKRIIQVSIIVFFGVVVALILFLTIRSLSNTTPDIIIGVKVKALHGSEIDSPALTEAESTFLKNFDLPIAAISLDYIYFSPSVISTELDSLCIESIYIQGDDENGVEFFRDKQILFDSRGQEFCLSESKQYYLSLQSIGYQQISLSNTNLDNRYYPFDSKKVDFNMSLNGYGKKNNTRVEFPEWTVSLDMVSVEWSENIKVSQETNRSNGISMILRRPILYRILFWVLPLIVLTSIVGLFLIESRGSILEVSMGMLSLWSIREIVVRDYVDSATLVDGMLTCLYILLGMSLVSTMIRRTKRRKRVDLADLARDIPYKKGERELTSWGNIKIKTEGISSVDVARAFFACAANSRSQNQKSKLKIVGERFLNFE